MKVRNFSLLTVKLLIIMLLVSCSGTGNKNISILETTDVHGAILPGLDASLASAFTYIKQVREKKDATVLIDNGDNLQGRPEGYF